MTNNPKQPRGPGGKFVKAGDGVTLRQWYAGQALVRWLSNEISMQAAARALKQDTRNGPSFIARSAFEIADAMIAADTATPSK